MARRLEHRTALQLRAAALAAGIAGVAVLGAGRLPGVLHLRAAHMVPGVLVAVGMPAQGAYRLFATGGRTALVRSGQLLPRQHRQPHAAVGQPLADTFGIPRMRAAGTPADQRRQHRAVGKRPGGLTRRTQEAAVVHRRVVGDLRAARDRTHVVGIGHRAAIARDAACVLAAGRDRAHVVAVGHRAQAAAGDAAHAVDARDRTGIAAGRHAARVIAHDAADISDDGFRIADIGIGALAADNDALVPAVQELRRVIGVPRDAAHIEPSVHIARHRQVFHRGPAQLTEQAGMI